MGMGSSMPGRQYPRGGLSVTHTLSGTEVAVIGMAGRFPGAANVEQLWANLVAGSESIRVLALPEVLAQGVDPAIAAEPSFVLAGADLAGVELFDAHFFGYSPAESEVMDPQHRLFLEVAWEAFEDAGYDSERVPGRTGVFAGAGFNTYMLVNLASQAKVRAALRQHDIAEQLRLMLGNAGDFLATRVSYKLDLRGPSLTVQTACSTSLLAIHLACQSLLAGECDTALAGGVALNLNQSTGYRFSPGSIASPDGHCRAFDAAAAGTVFGSGVGAVILKPLTEALAAGDRIYAILRGSAVNNDGSRKIGYAAPSVFGQAEVIVEALANAGVPPETISLVETHGTGTPLGDPVEIEALRRAFELSGPAASCALGAVKTNIGHLDAAAGVVSLIKTALSVERGWIPPNVHFATLNPSIDFASSPFYVNSKLREWDLGASPRRAGVSAFGIGGTNVHVILEQPPTQVPSTPPGRPWQIFPLSARTAAALKVATANLAEDLRSRPELEMADAAYTLQVGRRAFEHRRVALARSGEEAADVLSGRHPKRLLSGRAEKEGRPVAFLFPGQGAQYVGMTRSLYASEPAFREEIDRCCDQLLPELGFDLLDALYRAEGKGATARLQQTAVAQPALFTVEYALARFWMQWGVRPQAMLGHSVGEITAACLAGVFSLGDALALVAFRGRLMEELPGGAMIALPLSEQHLLPMLSDGLSLAAVNAPDRVVISGPPAEVAAFAEDLARQGISHRRLPTSHAFHSAMMEPILERFAAHLRTLRLEKPKIPFVSNLTGTWIDPNQATTPEYWVRQLRSTVRFSTGLGELLRGGERLLLEVGPGQTLSSLARQRKELAQGQVAIPSFGGSDEAGGDESAALLRAVGQLWLAGGDVDWHALHAGERRSRVRLPTYPFERRRFWIEPATTESRELTGENCVRRADLADWLYLPAWRQTPLPLSPAESSVDRAADAPWLIFCDAGGLGMRIARRLEESGRQVVTVEAAARFEHRGPGALSVDPCRRQDYDTLLQDVSASVGMPGRIVHLWGVTEGNGWSVFSGGDPLACGFQSLLFLAQALGSMATKPVHIAVVSDGAEAVSGSEEIEPLKSAVLGPCQVIPLEYPFVTCTSVDVAVPASGDERAATALTDRLIAELTCGPSTGRIALRGPRRWSLGHEAIRLETGGTSRLRSGGIYLITGGFGGIGLTLAGYLAERVGARLVLTGRTTLPERKDWDRWLAEQGEDHPVSRRIFAVRALEECGAEVLPVSADVTQRGEMAAVVRLAQKRFGTLHGVLHAAGIPGGGIIQRKDPKTAIAVLAPKVQGALALDAAVAGIDLDFMVLCSSVESVVGSPGQVDYCAANSVLDAFAAARSTSSRGFTLSISWDTWREVGMAADAALAESGPGRSPLSALRSVLLEQGLSPVEGAEVFGRILSHDLPPHVVVSTRDLAARSRDRSLQSLAMGEGDAEPRKAEHSRPDLGTPYVAPRDEREAKIAAIWEQVLRIEKIGIHDNFFELGGDSMTGLQVAAEATRCGLGFAPQYLFEYQTVSELAGVAQRAEIVSPESAELSSERSEQLFSPADFPDAATHQRDLDRLAAQIRRSTFR